MAYKDGSKSGGRQKGTKNKVTKALREMLLDFSNSTVDEAIRAFHMISDPDKKFLLWLKAVEFNVPKLSSVELKDELPKKTYAEELDELSEEYK